MLHSPPRNTDRLLCILFRKTTLYACIFLLPGSLSFCRLWCLCRHFTVHGLWCLFYLNALSGNTNTFVDTRQFLIRINTEIWQCFLQNFPRNALCIITVCLIFGICFIYYNVIRYLRIICRLGTYKRYQVFNENVYK